MKSVAILALVPYLVFVSAADAGCVLNAQTKTAFVVLDSHTFVLQGGIGPDILVKTFSNVRTNSDITVLKDSFCSFDGAAIYIDGELASLKQVERL